MKDKQKNTNSSTEEKSKYSYSDDAYERMGDDPNKKKDRTKKV